MDKDIVVYIHNGVLFSQEEGNHAIFRKICGNGDHCIQQNKPDSERYTSNVFSYMWNVENKRHERSRC
jgi:hypothetical protein